MKNARVESGKFKGKKLNLPSFATTRSTKSRVKACVFNTLRGELAGKIFVEVFGGSGAMAFEALSNYAMGAIIIEKDTKAYKIACENARMLLGGENLATCGNANLNFNGNLGKFEREILNSNENLGICDLKSLNFSENLRKFSVFSVKNTRIYNADSFELLPALFADEKFSQMPVIAYFDPPFHLRNGFDDIYERVFALINSLQNLKQSPNLRASNSQNSNSQALNSQNLNLQAFIIEHSSQISTPATLGIFTQYKFKKFGKTNLSFYHLPTNISHD